MPPPMPISTWQGFYIGASVGASWLHSVQDDTAAVGGLGTLVLFAGDWLERSVDHAPADASEADAPHRDAHTL